MLSLFGGTDGGPTSLFIYAAVCFYVAYRTIIKEWPTREANIFRNWVVGILTVAAGFSVFGVVLMLLFASQGVDRRPQPQPTENHSINARPEMDGRSAPQQQEGHGEAKMDLPPIDLSHLHNDT